MTYRKTPWPSPVLSTATDFNFGTNLQVTDDGDGTVTINAQVPDADLTDVSEDGSQVVTNASDINFTGHLNVTDDGDGSVTIDPTHNHDSRYYTQSESDSRYASSGHSHDGRYYTESQADSRFAPSSHNHDSRYYTKSQSNSNYASSNHNHDSRYDDRYYFNNGSNAFYLENRTSDPSSTSAGRMWIRTDL